MASWFVNSSLDREVWVQALARNIVLCSWETHFTLTVPLSIARCISWYQQTNAGGNPVIDYPIQGGGGGELLVASIALWKLQNKLRPDGPHDLYADLTNLHSLNC